MSSKRPNGGCRFDDEFVPEHCCHVAQQTRYYVLFVIEVERRVVHFLGATTNPNGPWLAQMARTFATDLEEAGRRVRFFVRDRDTKFTASFDRVFASMGAQTILTPGRSPNANAFAEPWARLSEKTASTTCSCSQGVTSRRSLSRTSATTTRADRIAAWTSRHRAQARSRRETAASTVIF